MKKLFLTFCLFGAHLIFSQDKMPFKIYDRSGQEVNYSKMLSVAKKNDVVLFGEIHNNSILHWLQLEFVKDLSVKNKLVLGAEMLERDNQDELNAYLAGSINQKKFDSVARLWVNYKTDYKPLVDFAKENKLAFIATNVPRKYASLVYKNDFKVLDTLSGERKNWVAPLPIEYDAELPGYKSMKDMGDGHISETLPKAQALKDATMAYSISQNLKEASVFVHFNGTYHSNNYEGINWYLRKFVPKVKIMTIATVEQENIDLFKKENNNLADFIIVVDSDVTKTH
ncbi:Protein of unknown function precursor [Flavobacterium indicum GPTSA100-9 = DSM 17447]|uniref:Haem-binding uptake Tiki superfamily ChaN domain-containing protein n=1 Tax=Flavobacterium indicum (strain DSM 17447 / CIP 109464 / GPTSA100-9) TaxID=1094466 RepID=H8XRZ8_FLAIG|nr:ChaN family lipoprotein [Flavobacterium indicum]CCG54582.1 Protein of unknown function precursor [Flavobacterium indicum GPTSA100-9 = DSM 17447]